ncbi:MAG: ABC transporter permease [Bryobacteraceae bacterium]|nr:ABC transporter permease [Bryobacteraceae bacterium]
MLREILYRLRALTRRDDLDRELEEELQYHLAREAEKLANSSDQVPDSMRTARLSFGPMESVKEQCREARGTSLIESFLADLRYGIRGLKKSPVFTLVAIASLAVGIGANSTAFSLLDRVVFRPLPVERPHELVILSLAQGGATSGFTYPFFREMQSRQTVLSGVLASADYPVKNLIVRGGGDPEAAFTRLVSGNYFEVLGIRAAIGRVLNSADDRLGTAGAAVISDRFWERRFQRSPAVLGTAVTLNKAQVTIVGVAPPEFFGEKPGSIPDVWVPLALQPQVMPSDLLSARFMTWLTVMGRLKPGVPPAAASASLTSIAAEIGANTILRKDAGPLTIGLTTGARGLEDLRREFGKPLALLMAMAGMVLTIVCFNLAMLLLARGAARVHEMGIRLALGAVRVRLVRQMLVESALLSIAGGVFGVALALLGGDALLRLAGGERETSMAMVLDGNMMVFTAAVTISATFLFGLAPALIVSAGASPTRSFGRQGRDLTAPRSLVYGAQSLMVLQVAVSLVVVCGAALLTRSLTRLRQQDFGIRPTGVILVKLPMELTPAARKAQELIRGEVIERIRAMPGVDSAAVSCCGPFDDTAHPSKAAAESSVAGGPAEVLVVHASEDYVETIGLRVLHGRSFTREDRKEAPPVALLTEHAATQLFGREPALGRRISFGNSFDSTKAMEVVGVLKNARFGGPRDEFRSLILVPMAQQPSPVTSISVRASVERDLRHEVRSILQQAIPRLGLGEVTSYSEVIEKKLHGERLLSLVSVFFAVQVLFLAAAGLFGLVWFFAANRERELGVRAAMGASPGDLRQCLLRRSVFLLLLGAIIGGAGSMGLTKAIRSLLFGVTSYDPFAFVVAVCVLILIGLSAAFVPAWRAGRADPLRALRAE